MYGFDDGVAVGCGNWGIHFGSHEEYSDCCTKSELDGDLNDGIEVGVWNYLSFGSHSMPNFTSWKREFFFPNG